MWDKRASTGATESRLTATGPPEGRRREVLRQASMALGGEVVTLWEVSDRAEVVPVATSVLDPPYHATVLDLDATLRRWSVPIIEGSRWVGCHFEGGRRWCVAPVRPQPTAPPSGGVERRSRERLTLELTGLCLGLLESVSGSRRERLPEPAALLELARHPSVIAHEVANPLSAALVSVDACLDAVRRADELDITFRGELQRELDGIAQGVERAVAYLRSIQDQTRGLFARFERFDVVHVVRSCVTLERALARIRGVGLNWEPSVESVYLQGDPNALYQILSNLIRNAVDATPEGGGAVTVGLERSATVLRLTVRDQGAGIAAEHLERIFEPGFTTKPFGRGSGIGLTVVREFSREIFGGTVTVESAVGRGSVFTVALPIPLQRAPGARN